MSDRQPIQTPDPDDLRIRDEIAKIRRFLLKKEPTVCSKEAHKRRKKEISQYHNRLVQEDRDDSLEARKAYRDIRIEDEEIGYCDDLLSLIGMGERVAAQDEEHQQAIAAENALLAELEQVRWRKAQIRSTRDRLFDDFGAMANRLSRQRTRIDAGRRAPLEAEYPEPQPAPARPAPARATAAAAPQAAPAPRDVPEPAPQAVAAGVPPLEEPRPAPARPAEPEPLAPEEDILDLDASMIESEPPQAEAGPAGSGPAMSDDEIAALFDEKPAPKPAPKPSSQDDIDALLDSAMGPAEAPAPKPAPKSKPGTQDDIDALLASMDDKPAAKPAPKAAPSSQDDIDALLASMDDKPAAKPAPKAAAKPASATDDFDLDAELELLDKK